MNSSLWTVVSHIREEESLVQGRWAEHMRQPQGEETAKRRRTVELKVKFITITLVKLSNLYICSGGKSRHSAGE